MGLPATGPAPKHFHHGSPTPWREGCAIRFWCRDGSEWVGNFQGGSGAKIVRWPEADSILVGLAHALYVFDASGPGSYVGLSRVEEYLLSGTWLFVAEFRQIHAYGPERQQLWSRHAFFYPHFEAFEAGVLTVAIEPEMGEPEDDHSDPGARWGTDRNKFVGSASRLTEIL